MEDQAKTKAQLLTELAALRQRLTRLETLADEREKDEQALRVSEERYRRLVERSPDGIVIHSDHKIVFANPAAAAILGADTPQKIIGKPSLDFVHPDDHQMIAARGEKIASHAWEAPLTEQKLVRLDGTVIDVEAVGIPTTYQGKPAIQGIFRDVTERKRTAQALQKAEARYRTLVEQLPAITYIVEFDDEGGKTTFISPQVETLLGFTQEEWLADRYLWVKQIHPDDQDKVLAAVKRSNAGNTALDIEYRVLARNGQVLWFRNQQTTLMQDETGQLAQIHGVMYNITEQKKLAERLQQAQRMEAIGQMAAGIAHNFNNLLTALIGHTELALVEVPSTHPAHSDLEGVRKSAQRAAELTQQLLAFTRRQIVQPKIINLNDLLVDMQPTLHAFINANIKLELSLAADLAPIKIDPSQVEQILANLLTNARDAMPDGGTITIETANLNLNSTDLPQQPELSPGQYVLLAVTDTGTGITQAVKPHIFEPFFTTKEVDKGTGLGLSTCFGIVRQNGGHITVYSEPEQGTTFKVYLPGVATNSSTTSSPQLKPPTAASNSKTILLVDDEPMVRELAFRVLSRQGYNVLAAANGEEALQLLETQPRAKLHLLITDIGLPKISGDTLANRLIDIYPSLNILFITGYAEAALARRGILQTKAAILSKPFTPDALSQKVHSVLTGENQ